MKSGPLLKRTACTLCAVLAIAIAAHPASLDINFIEHTSGLKGAWSVAGVVFEVSVPRNDVAVEVDEWRMPPFMGLTSWAAYLAGKQADAMVMGDLVLFEDQMNPVMSAVLEVHSPPEFAKGHVTGAINLSIHSPDFATNAAQVGKKKPILVNCNVGSDGVIAAAELARPGFKSVFNLEGGVSA